MVKNDEKPAVDELKRSEQRYRKLVETLHCCIAIYEAVDGGEDFVFLDFNQQAEKTEATPKMAVLGKRVTQVFPGVTDFGLLDVFKRVWQSGIPQRHPITLYKDNRIAGWRENFVFRLPGGEIVAAYEDATERKRIEQALTQSQKMEALGTLAGGLAHEINNTLMVVLGVSSVLANRLSIDDPMRRHVDDIVTAAEQGRNIVQNLLALSHKGKARREEMQLENLLDRLINIFSQTLSKEIHFETELDERANLVSCDRDQMTQVLMNLFRNAVDALPDGGTISITTREEIVTKGRETDFPELAPGRFCRIEVADNGSGMDQKTLKRAFEPFFTTKEIGQGTGLGLSFVYNCLYAHGGTVHLISEKGVGTTVTLVHPLVAPAREGLAKPIESSSRSVKTARILLVDDEELVRTTGRLLLETLGHSVTTVDRGEAAVELYRQKHREIDLVLLDLSMPHVDGRECYKQLLEIEPQVRVILSTGYLTSREALSMKDNVTVLPKPYGLDGLRQAIAEAMADRNRYLNACT